MLRRVKLKYEKEYKYLYKQRNPKKELTMLSIQLMDSKTSVSSWKDCKACDKHYNVCNLICTRLSEGHSLELDFVNVFSNFLKYGIISNITSVNNVFYNLIRLVK